MKNEFSMKETAVILDLPFGRNILYEYLKQLNVIQPDRKPYPEFIELGYFSNGAGSMNRKSSKKYTKTMVTLNGISWLLNYMVSKIMEADRLYLENKKIRM